MTRHPNIPFQSLPLNNMGTDYFVGDIHGDFEHLEQALQSMGFDESKDRLISVGDLVDRGAHSEHAIEWLTRPYFHAVRGNHEQMYLYWWNLRHRPVEQKQFEEDIYFNNGGQWVSNVSLRVHEQLAQSFEQLSYMLVVPSKQGELIAAVHAGLPDGCSWPQLTREPLTSETLGEMLWSRNRLLHHWGERKAEPVWDDGVIPGLHAVVCGHMMVTQPTWVGRFYYIETGGWRTGGKFSIVPLSQIVQGAHQRPMM